MSVKLGVVVFRNWRFFKELHHELGKSFEIKTFDGYDPKLKLINEREHIKGFIEDKIVNKKKIDGIMKWSDVTFFEWASHFLEIGTRFSKKVPMVARMHRFELFKFADKIDWKKLDKLILVSEGIRRWALDRIDIDRSRTAVIYNAVNTDFYQPVSNRAEPTFRLGILGDIIPRKRVYELVLAFKELTEEIKEPGLELSIGGKMEGEYGEFVKNLIERLEMKDSVKLEGFVEDIVEWYNGIDIIVGNSMHESAHITLYEGQACGCYPISHFWDGADEFLERSQLYYTNAEFIERVRAYYDMSDAVRRSYREKGRSYVRDKFELTKIAGEFKALFDEIAH